MNIDHKCIVVQTATCLKWYFIHVENTMKIN